MSGFTEEQKHILSDKMHPATVAKHPHTGADYIEGWMAIASMNRIFGPDGWKSELLMCDQAFLRPDMGKKGDQWHCVYVATVRVTVWTQSGQHVTRDGAGDGTGFARQVGDAISGARKEAATDAFKRAAMQLGYPLGLACYDKKKRFYGTPKPFTPKVNEVDKGSPEKEQPKEAVPGPEAPPGVTDLALSEEMTAILAADIKMQEMLHQLGTAVAGWGGREALTDDQSGAVNGFCYGLPLLTQERKPSVELAKNSQKLGAWNLAREYCMGLQEWEASIGGGS